jgi:hypothetical protein
MALGTLDLKVCLLEDKLPHQRFRLEVLWYLVHIQDRLPVTASSMAIHMRMIMTEHQQKLTKRKLSKREIEEPNEKTFNHNVACLLCKWLVGV